MSQFSESSDQDHTGPERVTLRRVSADFAFADVRLPDVNLCGLRVERTPWGITITPPVVTGRDGRVWPAYRLQPGTREAIESAIRELWLRGRA